MKTLDEAMLRLAEVQHGVFSRRQAYAAGGTPSACDRRIRAGRWCETPYRCVYRLGGYPCSWHQRLMAAVLSGPPPTVASHRAAAVLHGVRGGMPIEVTIPPHAHRRVGPAVVHQAAVNATERAVVAGILVTTPDRTLLDLASVVDEHAVEQALEAAFRKGLTTPQRVRRYVDSAASPGRRGIVRIRRVLDRRPSGRPAGSALEVKLVRLLRAAGLPEPVRQFEVRLGAERYFVDLAYPEQRLAIELDGYEHHSDMRSFHRDRVRQNALVLAGWTVLRFTWADVVEHPADVVAIVSSAVQSRQGPVLTEPARGAASTAFSSVLFNA
jgi:very-short-patch-repair endonuclease